MSLISCPECDRLVSSFAAACIQCGYPLGAVATREAPHHAGFAGAYAPPEPAPPLPRTHTLFPVTTTKFVVMSICTFGMYDVYWCYRMWQRVAAETREPVSPFWRAFFAPFCCFGLFARIRELAERRRTDVAWSGALLGALYLVLSVTWRLPDPWWLVSLATFLPFLPVVRTVERVHATETALEGPNGSFSGANIAGIVVGALLLVLVLVGLTLPPVP